jgi:uncharacterized membrane protein
MIRRNSAQTMPHCSAVINNYHLNFLMLVCYKRSTNCAGDDMEVFGGFMVMMSIITLFLAVVWLIMPFVVFAIKGKQDRTLEVLEAVEKRLAAIENAYVPGGLKDVVTRKKSRHFRRCKR